MAQMFGDLSVSAGGQDYTLRLGMAALADLQEEYGRDLAPLMEMQDGGMPPFAVLLRVVEVALRRHHPDAGRDVADDILAECPDILGQLLAATFPEAPAAGERQARPRKAPARR